MSAELSFKYSFPQSNRNWTNYKWSQTPQFNRIDLTSIKGLMAVMIPMDKHSSEKGFRMSGESESRMLWGGVVKELRAPVIGSRLTFMEHFQSWTMFRNFVSHPVSTFIRIKDSRPSKTVIKECSQVGFHTNFECQSDDSDSRLNVSWLLVWVQTKHGPSLT